MTAPPHLYLAMAGESMMGPAAGLHAYLAGGGASGSELVLAAKNLTLRPKFLISFHYYRTKNLDEWLGRLPGQTPMIFADSGAFSAHVQGVDVDVEDYAEWLHRWRHHFTTYVNLDVIGDEEATAENQRILEAADLAPIPVFHGGERPAVLEGLCERYPYVALGGMVASNDALLWRWLVRCFKTAERYGTVFHGFGQTRRKIVESLPWYSVDSSSWGAGHRFGQVQLWDPVKQTIVKVPLYDRPAIGKVARLIREHGQDPQAFVSREGYKREPVIACSALAWMKWEQHVRSIHGPIRLRDTADGPHLYLADNAEPNFAAAAEGLSLYLADGSDANLTMVAEALVEKVNDDDG